MVRKHFGTDGIRGLANVAITPELAMKVAQAAGVFPPGGKAAEIFGVKAIDDEPLLRYLKLC